MMAVFDYAHLRECARVGSVPSHRATVVDAH